MPDPVPLNALPPGRQQRITLPPDTERPPVRVHIVSLGADYWTDGVAHGWNRDAVYVHWTDSQGYDRIDYFPASDVVRC